MLSELQFFGQRSLDTSDVIDNGLPVDEDQHLNALEERSQQLKVLHINTQSMTSTFDRLLMTIDRYSSRRHSMRNEARRSDDDSVSGLFEGVRHRRF